MNIKSILEKYDKENITIAVLGSHSALDVCRGAKDLGFKTLVITQKGRGAPYSKYYKTQSVIASEARQSQSIDSEIVSSKTPRNDDSVIGCVDEVLELDNFKDILKEENQKILREKNVVFIPHRSFEVYINDYDAIENDFQVPMFGNRKLLRSEERGTDGIDQYKIMDEAGIRYPKQFKDPEEIDRLVIVKVLEKERGFERAFFLVNSFSDFQDAEEAFSVIEQRFTADALDNAVIEEFLVGVQVNFNFFYDPVSERLELLGTDTRRQTNIEGLTKLPANDQKYVKQSLGIKFEEAGHIAVTVLESLLEPAFEIGEKFVEGCKKLGMPVIGPFGLQTMIIPGPPKKEIIVFDVSPRMPGSPGIKATPYSGYLFGKSVSAGERVAMQIKEAIENDKLEQILT
jgi:5-formaminoimidazole-4-carboxamide-1-(beta)-D-ribofuranosyl 5'-monophosphate synthetase